MSLEQLIDMYKTGKLTAPLDIDNDATYVYAYTGNGDPDTDADPNAWQKVFSMHPGELLEALLDRAGIPHQSA